MNGYEDIIGLPHHQSAKHPRMSNYDRAAQFSPFAALTGYDDAIEEAARVTQEEVELSEDTIARLDEKMADIAARISEKPQITATYFKRDGKKEGGSYERFTGRVKKVDTCNRAIVFCGGFVLPFKNVVWLEET